MTVSFPRPPQQPSPAPAPGVTPTTPVVVNGVTHSFAYDSGTPQTIINNKLFNLKRNRADFQPDPRGPSFEKNEKTLKMVFKRVNERGEEEDIPKPCDGPVILGDVNMLGSDQLKITDSVVVFGFGESPAGKILPKGRAPAGSSPRPHTGGTPRVTGVTMNGKGCPKITTPASPDGNLTALIDTGANYTTVGPVSAEKLKACKGVKSKGMMKGVPTNTGLRDCEVLEGVEINIPLDDGTVVTCKLDVIVMDGLLIGTDQLEFLNLVFIGDGDGFGLWPKGKSPIDPWKGDTPKEKSGDDDSRIVSNPPLPVIETAFDWSVPSAGGIPLQPGGSARPGLRRPSGLDIDYPSTGISMPRGSGGHA